MEILKLKRKYMESEEVNTYWNKKKIKTYIKINSHNITLLRNEDE